MDECTLPRFPSVEVSQVSAMPLQGYRPEERVALVDVLARLMGESGDTLRVRDSIWKSLERFEEKGAFFITFHSDEIVLWSRNDPERLTLPRSLEFVKLCNERFHPKTRRMEEILRSLFEPPRPPPPTAEIIPIAKR